MASGKQIRDEIMKLTIAINSDPAQKEIHALREENNKLSDSIDTLKKRKEDLGRRNKTNAAEFDALTKEIKKNTETIGFNNSKIEELRGSMDITRMTVSQLKKELSLLNMQKLNVVPGSEAAQRLDAQLQAVRDRLQEVSTGASQSQTSFSDLADKFNHYSGIITAGAAVLVGFGLTAQNIIDRNNKMADAFSGVEKTTGMTRQEVEQLTKAFADFDTRTSKIDLLAIAEQGGRLGVSKSQIQDFVREVDKANVALGDSWSGGAAKVAESLGKITTLYSSTKDLPIAQSINEIGSALNELAADGAASESNIADFTTRIGAMPAKLKPAIGEVMGIGAALEESGIDAERGATAFSNFMTTAAKETAKFAEVMRVPEKQVKDMINSNPTEFFLKFSEGLKGLDATELASILDHLKLNDQYVKSVLGTASENTQRFREQIDLSNESMKEATSLQEEFDKINNNAAATWEKLNKKLGEFFTSSKLSEFLIGAIDLFGKFVGVTDEGNKAFEFYRNTLFTIIKILAVVAASYISTTAAVSIYNAVLKKNEEQTIALTVIEKTRNVITAASNALTTLYTATLSLLGWAYAKVAGQTAQATFAMNTFKIAMATNPIGAIVALVSILATAFFTLSQIMDDNTEEIKDNTKELSLMGQTMKRVTDEQAKSVGEFQSKVEPLIAILKDEKSQLQDRKKAYEELIKIAPEFKGTLDAEYNATSRLTSVYDALIDKIKKAAEVRALQASLDEIYTKKIKEENKSELADTALENMKKDSKNKYKQLPNTAGVQLMKNITADATKNIKELDTEADRIVKRIADMSRQENSPKYNVPESDASEKSSRPKTDRAEKHQENNWKAILKEYEKYGETAEQLARQIELDIEDARIDAMNEGFEKELAALNLQEQRKAAEIDKKKVQKSSFDKIDEQIAKATGADKLFFEALKASWIKNNDELENLKTAQDEINVIKQKALKYKYKNQEFKESQEAHQQKINELQRQYNDEFSQYETLEQLKAGLKGRLNDSEISRIRTWEDGKQALQKVYHKAELQAQISHLQTMISLYEGMDLSVLTAEQRKEVLKFIDEAKTKLSELNAAKKGEDSGAAKTKDQKFGKGDADLLGFTSDDWEGFYANIQNGTDMLGTMKMAVSALSSAFSTYYSYVEANERRQMASYQKNTDNKKKRLKNQLDQGIINQETYKRETLKLDQDLDKRKAELELKAAKRQRNMQIGQAIASTAMAVINAMNTTPFMPLGLAMAIIAGTMGAIQIATILNSPLPQSSGYEEGFNKFGDEYPMQRAQDGKTFNVRRSRLKSGPVSRPTHFIAGENGLEMVIDSPTWTTYSPELKSAIYSANARANGFERGFNTVPEKVSSAQNNDEMMLKIINVLGEYTSTMKTIQQRGIPSFIVKNARTGKDLQDMLDDNQNLIDKNKH